MAAELGTMKVTEQIDAIRCLGADPLQEMIAPRFIGIIISSFFLLGLGLVGLAGHAALGERLGRNARFGALGNGLAAAVMGATGAWLSSKAVFFLTAGLCVPALAAVWLVPAPPWCTKPAQCGSTKAWGARPRR